MSWVAPAQTAATSAASTACRALARQSAVGSARRAAGVTGMRKGDRAPRPRPRQMRAQA